MSSLPFQRGSASPCRHCGLQHRRDDRLQQAYLAGALDTASVGADEDIARALVALGTQPLQKRIRLGVDAVDLDARQVGKVAVQRFIGIVVAGRIKVQRRRGLGTADDGETEPSSQASRQKQASLHGSLRFASDSQLLIAFDLQFANRVGACLKTQFFD